MTQMLIMILAAMMAVVPAHSLPHGSESLQQKRQTSAPSSYEVETSRLITEIDNLAVAVVSPACFHCPRHKLFADYHCVGGGISRGGMQARRRISCFLFCRNPRWPTRSTSPRTPRSWAPLVPPFPSARHSATCAP